MNSGIRHKVQRQRRARLKADAIVLLDRLLATGDQPLSLKQRMEIAELRMRLQPPVGVKAPIIFTGYTKG